MLIACKCLNTLLEVEANEVPLMDVSSLQLNEKVSQNAFFNQKIKQVLRLSKVTHMLPMLINTCAIDNWTIEHCLNCNVQTHAVMNGEKGAALILINANLLTRPEIDEVRNLPSFSKVYKILVYDIRDAERLYDYIPAEVEQSIKVLKQKADESYLMESRYVDERIRIYTLQLQQQLEDFKDRAFAEHKSLKHVLLKHQLAKPYSSLGAIGKQRSTNSEVAKKEHTVASNLRKVPDEFDQMVKTPSPQKFLLNLDDTPMGKHSPLEKKNSLDAECLFDIEGMDDTEALDEGEYSDSDDNGIPIKQNRNGHRQQDQNNIAKSLPMNIPALMSVRSQAHDDSDEDCIHAEKTKDIAASIQALAKSVNGDAVFGDLPRTRCRTNIA